jgi:hypothetical protein
LTIFVGKTKHNHPKVNSGVIQCAIANLPRVSLYIA